jgi:hypothetical protein
MKKTKAKRRVALPSHIKTASFYGFLPAADYIEEFSVTNKDHLKAGLVKKGNVHTELEERIALIRMFTEKKMASLPQPIMMFYKSPMLRQEKGEDLISHHPSFNLDIIGNSKSIADAILIETSYVIAKEEYSDCSVSVELNTLGDRESMARLQRELGAFYRKNWSKVPKELQPLYKKDIFESLRTDNKKAVEPAELAPDTISRKCLST